jgi:hypothetical protein
VVDRRALAGGPSLTGRTHPGIFQILIEYKYVNKMAQQTAVQMLIEYIKKKGFDLEYEMEMSFLDHEKEQMIDFYNWMRRNDTPENAEYYYHYSDEDMLTEYYNQTYSK